MICCKDTVAIAQPVVVLSGSKILRSTHRRRKLAYFTNDNVILLCSLAPLIKRTMEDQVAESQKRDEKKNSLSGDCLGGMDTGPEHPKRKREGCQRDLVRLYPLKHCKVCFV